MKVVIAEKPSVAREIAAVIGAKAKRMVYQKAGKSFDGALRLNHNFNIEFAF